MGNSRDAVRVEKKSKRESDILGSYIEYRWEKEEDSLCVCEKRVKEQLVGAF